MEDHIYSASVCFFSPSVLVLFASSAAAAIRYNTGTLDAASAPQQPCDNWPSLSLSLSANDWFVSCGASRQLIRGYAASVYGTVDTLHPV